MTTRFALIIGSLALILAPAPRTVFADDTLQTIIEKAAERESLFDNVTASFSYERSSGAGRRGGMRGGRRPANAPRRERAPRPERAPRGDTARRPQRFFGSGSNTTTATWARSGPSEVTRTETTRTTDSGTVTFNMAQGTDGETTKFLAGIGDQYRGFITPAGERGPMRGIGLSPDSLGVTALPQGRDSLTNLLMAEPYEMTFNRPRRASEDAATTFVITRDTRLLGTETIDGRDLIVVEATEDSDAAGRRGPRGFSSTRRLYFDPDLNYAVVSVESGRGIGDDFQPRSRWTFSDFREVRPGLFVPFSSLSENRNRDGQWLPSMTFQLNSLDFPAHLDPSVFDVQFPPGTNVRDGFIDLNYVAGAIPDDAIADLFAAPLQEGTSVPAPLHEGTSVPAPLQEGTNVPSRPWLIPSLLVFAAAVFFAIFLYLRRTPR